MNNQFPIKTLNQLRPVLIGFRKIKGFTQKMCLRGHAVTQQTYAAPKQTLLAPVLIVCTRYSVFWGRNNVVIYFPFTLHFPHRDEGLFDNTPARREKW